MTLLDQILLGLLVLSQMFWIWTVQKLVNKLMSRNFWEYQAAKSPPKHDPAPAKPLDAEEDIAVF